MKVARLLFSLFICSNLFIAVCAVAMVQQVYHLVVGEPVNAYYLGFVFFATLCSYNFHWTLTYSSVIRSPRLDWAIRHRKIHILLFIAGLAGALTCFYYLSQHWMVLLVVAFMTFLYSAPKIPHPLFRALRKVALGKTIFLSLVWTGVTSIVPILISEADWTLDETLFTIARFFLIYSICIIFDYRDREDDKKSGVRSLITYMDKRGISILFAISVCIALISTGLLYFVDYKITDVAILELPVVITACLYRYATRHFDDMIFYFVLDGLMALSAFIMLLARI